MVKTIWAKSNQPITLPCDLKTPVNGNYELEWRRGSALIFNAFGNDPGYAVAELQGRLARAASLGITIHAVREDDHATYRCAITKFNQNGKTSPEYGTPFRLLVYTAPAIQHPTQGRQIFVTPGANVAIECSASGFPPPEVVWSQNNKIVSLNATLALSNFAEGNAGEYTCLATNFEGTSETTVQVLFANGASMRRELTNKTVVEGATVFWQCEVDAHPLTISYRWLKGDRDVQATDLGLRSYVQDGEFGISLIKSGDSGWYTCEASNGYGVAVQSKAYLNVQYKPKIKSLNRRVYTIGLNATGTVSCETDANPPVTFVQWIKDGRAVVPSPGERLRITNAEHSDAGVYSCQTYNAIGSSDVLEIHVVVAEPPKFSKSPPPLAYVTAGEDFFMECAGFGDPPPVQYWLRHMVRYPNNVLQLSNVSHSDSGIYRCILTNAVTTIHTDLHLFVKDTPPQCPTEKRITCAGERMLEITFEAGYDGGHPQTFQLLRREVDIQGRRLSDWTTTDLDNLTGTTTDLLTLFSFHELHVVARNALGETRCTLGIHNVCSRPRTPQRLLLDANNVLSWDPSPEADSYKISFRRDSEHTFAQLAETRHTSFTLNSELLQAGNGDTNSELQFVVRAARAPFPDSDDSAVLRVSYGINDTSGNVAAATAMCAMISVLCLLCYFFKRRQLRETRRKYMYAGTNVNTFASTQKNAPHCFSHFEATSMPFDADESPWTLESSVTGERLSGINADDEDLDFNADDCSVVNTMLREKYMENPEYQKLNLLDELRLERLKQELSFYVH